MQRRLGPSRTSPSRPRSHRFCVQSHSRDRAECRHSRRQTATPALLSWLWKSQLDRDTAAQQGLAAAQEFIGVLTNVDAGKLDENFALAAEGSTGEFKDVYTQSSAQLRQLLVENKAAAHGVVVESAVKSASANHATVPKPRLDRSRIRVTMDKADGRWLASKVELP